MGCRPNHNIVFSTGNSCMYDPASFPPQWRASMSSDILDHNHHSQKEDSRRGRHAGQGRASARGGGGTFHRIFIYSVTPLHRTRPAPFIIYQKGYGVIQRFQPHATRPVCKVVPSWGRLHIEGGKGHTVVTLLVSSGFCLGTNVQTGVWGWGHCWFQVFVGWLG